MRRTCCGAGHGAEAHRRVAPRVAVADAFGVGCTCDQGQLAFPAVHSPWWRKARDNDAGHRPPQGIDERGVGDSGHFQGWWRQRDQTRARALLCVRSSSTRSLDRACVTSSLLARRCAVVHLLADGARRALSALRACGALHVRGSTLERSSERVIVEASGRGGHDPGTTRLLRARCGPCSPRRDRYNMRWRWSKAKALLPTRARGAPAWLAHTPQPVPPTTKLDHQQPHK